MNGAFVDSSKYIMLRLGYIVIKLVTVHCSFLYFELVSTIT